MSISYENEPKMAVWTLHLRKFENPMQLDPELQKQLERWDSSDSFSFRLPPYGKFTATVKQIGHVASSERRGNLNLKLYARLVKRGQTMGYVVRNYFVDYNVPILQVHGHVDAPRRYGYHARVGHTPKTREKGYGEFDWAQSQAIYDWLRQERYHHDVVMAFGQLADGTLEFTVFQRPEHGFPLSFAHNYGMNSPEPDELRIFELACNVCGVCNGIGWDPELKLVFCGKACQGTMY